MSRISLKGKKALVTGGAKRIGRAIVLALADEGVNVVIHYGSSKKEAEELAEEIASRGVESWTVQADFTSAEQRETLLDRAITRAGSLDLLINNASIFPSEKLADVTFESMISNMRINAWTPFELGREFAGRMGKGMIINLLDSRIFGYDWSHAGYIWSKHVLAVMTRMMALEYAPDVAVNAVAPGLILPPPGQDQSYLDRLIGTVPLKRHGEPEDIADAVVFLTRSGFITGEVICVDGGRHLKEYTNG